MADNSLWKHKEFFDMRNRFSSFDAMLGNLTDQIGNDPAIIDMLAQAIKEAKTPEQKGGVLQNFVNMVCEKYTHVEPPKIVLKDKLDSEKEGITLGEYVAKQSTLTDMPCVLSISIEGLNEYSLQRIVCIAWHETIHYLQDINNDERYRAVGIENVEISASNQIIDIENKFVDQKNAAVRRYNKHNNDTDLNIIHKFGELIADVKEMLAIRHKESFSDQDRKKYQRLSANIAKESGFTPKPLLSDDICAYIKSATTPMAEAEYQAIMKTIKADYDHKFVEKQAWKFSDALANKLNSAIKALPVITPETSPTVSAPNKAAFLQQPGVKPADGAVNGRLITSPSPLPAGVAAELAAMPPKPTPKDLAIHSPHH